MAHTKHSRPRKARPVIQYRRGIHFWFDASPREDYGLESLELVLTRTHPGLFIGLDHNHLNPETTMTIEEQTDVVATGIKALVTEQPSFVPDLVKAFLKDTGHNLNQGGLIAGVSRLLDDQDLVAGFSELGLWLKLNNLKVTTP